MFRLDKFETKRVLKSDFIDKMAAEAFFTTRDLPLKYGERNDLIHQIEQNKELVCKGLNIENTRLFIPQQTHSDNVEIIDEKKLVYPECDGLITNQKNIAIALNFADCVPLIFYDEVKKVAAISHAGWRGTVAKIGPKTIEKMSKNFGSKPEDIIALIGPSIGKCCFEVKQDVLNQIISSVSGKTENAVTDMHADLKQINKIQLLAIGVKKIDVCEYCTSCQSELFFSYRKEKGNTARHSAVIMIRGEDN